MSWKVKQASKLPAVAWDFRTIEILTQGTKAITL